MSRTSREELDRRALEVLLYVDRKTDYRTGATCLALRDIVNELGISVNCVRFTIRHLQQTGLILKRERFLPNGGQLENEYMLTGKGRQMLETSKEPVLNGR